MNLDKFAWRPGDITIERGALKYDPDEPRDQGGQWTSGGGQSDSKPEAVIAYHGTAENVAQNIIAEGIKVEPKKSYWPGLYTGERGESVFLTTDKFKAREYALRAASHQNWEHPAEGVPVIFKLRVPKDEWAKFKEDEHDPTARRRTADIPPAWIVRAFVPKIGAAARMTEGRVIFRKDDGSITVYMVIHVIGDGEANKYSPDEPRDDHGQWSGEGFHGTYQSNVKSILENGILTHRVAPYSPAVYIARDPGTAASFSGDKSSSRVVFKVEVPEKFREKFSLYSFEPNTYGAMRGSIKIRPEWIKAWAPVKRGSFDLGAWNDVKKDDAGDTFYLCVAFPPEEDTQKYSPDQPRDDHGQWTSGGGGAGDSHMLVRESDSFHGLDIAIEARGGQTRINDKGFSTSYTADYGYIKDVPVGGDGEPPDVYLGPHRDAKTVYVIDELSQTTGTFKQVKSMAGFKTMEAAREAYLGTSSKSEKSIGSITAVPIKEWLKLVRSGHIKDPFSYVGKFEVLYKYNPDQPRVPAGGPGGGQWAGDGSAGIAARGFDAAKEKRAEWVKSSSLQTVEGIIAAAPANQKLLARVGYEIARATGAEFKNPGVKTKTERGVKRFYEKINAGRTPAGVTDIVRAGFSVDTPAQAVGIVAGLAKHFPTIDEGWRANEYGYFDRSALVRFKDGMVGEIQIMAKQLAEAKSNSGGGGHALYQTARSLPEGNRTKIALTNQMKRLYGRAYSALSADWKAELGSMVRISG